MQRFPFAARRGSAAWLLPGLVLSLLALVASAPAWSQPEPTRAKPEDVGVSSERLRRVDEVIKRHIDEHHIAIERDGMTDPNSWVSVREQYR